MAYPALISLNQTIHRLKSSPHISVLPSSLEILQLADNHIISLKQALDVSDSSSISFGEKVKALDAVESHLSEQFPSEYIIIRFAFKVVESLKGFLEHNIILNNSKKVSNSDGQVVRNAVHKLEHVLKSFVIRSKKSEVLYGDLEKVEREISVFTQTVLQITEEYSKGDENSLPEASGYSSRLPKFVHIFSAISEFAGEAMEAVLQRFDRSRSIKSIEKLNDLDGKIRDEARKLEDALESHVLSHQFVLRSSSLITLELQKVKKDIYSFTQSAKNLKAEYINELFNLLPEEDGDNAVMSLAGFGGNKSKMVGYFDEFSKIRDELIGWTSHLKIFSFYGMAGIGKTTLARELYEDLSLSGLFERRAWVSVGPKHQLKEIVQAILAEVNPNSDKTPITEEGKEKLGEYLHQSLNGRRYLIVLDNVWHKHVWDGLKRLLPDNSNGSHVLLTTRLKIAYSISWDDVHKLRFLNKEESWRLFCEKVFGEKTCPPKLENAGRKIVKNCEGLPLTIVTTANLLLEDETKMTSEYWNKVAEKQNSFFEDVYDQMSEVLLPSYTYLSKRLKSCFLYMGAFPQNYEIPSLKLIQLWSAEGLLLPDWSGSAEHNAVECLKGLFFSNLLMVHQEASYYTSTSNILSGFRTCRLHSAFWHLCVEEAGKSKFLYVINSYGDHLGESIKNQRRLCIHKNILFGIKDVYNSMASISSTRSLLCTGPHHEYPVPICFNLRLLKILDSLTIRFYEFPSQVLELVQLRYLTFTFNGDIPSSISTLRNLETLIVRRHLSIKSTGSTSDLPIEIWDMKELKHLQVTGSNLHDPCGGAVLPNLVTLLDVSPHSCTKGVFEGLPNLEILSVRIELPPDAFRLPLCSFFDHVSKFNKLEILKCVVVNATLMSEVVTLPTPLSIFSSSLRKLTMSGFGYSWERMSVIGSLPKLKVLKLRCYAFRGEKWELEDDRFRQLGFLVIEDTDVVHWTIGRGSFNSLRRLSLKNCCRLEEIPRDLGKSVNKIEVVDCNPSAASCAQRMQQEYGITVNIHSSWNEGKLES